MAVAPADPHPGDTALAKHSTCNSTFIGCQKSSVSRKATKAPVAAAMLVFRAAAAPPFARLITRSLGSATIMRRAMSPAVLSVDPSSTTMISRSMRLCGGRGSRVGDRRCRLKGRDYDRQGQFNHQGQWHNR
jgi:hypothetical protein